MLIALMPRQLRDAGALVLALIAGVGNALMSGGVLNGLNDKKNDQG